MSLEPDTLAIHAGQAPDPATNARAVPIADLDRALGEPAARTRRREPAAAGVAG